MADVTSAFDRTARRSRRTRVRPHTGQGQAWLVADTTAPGFRCYWFGSGADATLWERGRTASAREAVAWGLSRTGRVRIRATDGTTAWAGTATRPAGVGPTWSDPTLGTAP